MGTANKVADTLRQTMKNEDRSAAWVARASGIPYKRVLAEVVHGYTPLKLDTALQVSAALGKDLPSVIDSAQADEGALAA